MNKDEEIKQQKLSETTEPATGYEQVLCGVRSCSFFVIVRVLDKYFKTKVDAKSIEHAEQIIEKTIAGFEYQIMNIYKANE